MDNFIIFFVAIVIALAIAALSSSRRRPNTHNYDTTNGGDYIYQSSGDAHHYQHHGHIDHSSGFDCSSGDSGSCDSGGGGCD
ncbi:MAG TPA: hypothetical protein VN456_10460 [Desulfosporosinus sp.]|nr:hypothetical protein [Desulfosporosinus sp.]